jgi:hypothetical protein
MSHLLTLMAILSPPAGAAGDTISLTGNPGTPYITEKGGASPGTNVTYTLGTDGILYLDASPLDPPTQWNGSQPTPTTDYWVRVMDFSGDGYNAGSADGSWQKISGSGSSNITFTWVYTAADLNGFAKVEIALDSGGTTIVATGYYGANIHAAA